MTKRRILYADDYVDFGVYFNQAAERLGHEPVFVNDAARAWELIQAGQAFDLIISDYDMPEMNGLKFLKLVRAHPPSASTPFVLYTASDTADLSRAVASLGAVLESKGQLISWSTLISKHLSQP